jgi:hypothetical protein
MLGRQGFHVSQEPESWQRAKRIASIRIPGSDPEQFLQADGYSETFLRYLGAQSVISMDFSDYEGAEIIHDLNTPVPCALENRFDFIFDGGTLEHVYNIPVAMGNIKSMLRCGGVFVSANAANNQLGHGIYQFCPELFWVAFGPESGFAIEQMALVPRVSGETMPERIPLVDAGSVRQEIGQTPSATYLIVAVRRVSPVISVENGYQRDYVAAWKARMR